MKIASWNVNSIKMRADAVENWLGEQQADILCLQELKGEAANFPAARFQALGYQAEVVGQKAYNGVAILSKAPVKVIYAELPGAPEVQMNMPFIQARYLEVQTTQGWHVINIYAPNGNPLGTEKYDYKLAWLAALQTRLQTLLKAHTPFVVLGDFNIIPADIDCRNPAEWRHDALFQMPVKQWYQTQLNSGLTDAWRSLHGNKQEFTFWDYTGNAWPRNDGIRIDHVLLSPALADRLQTCTIDTNPRAAPSPSDHTVIMTELLD